MADADVSGNLSRYDALLRISKTLSAHKTIAELFEVLADQLHAIVPFDYLALLLHDEPTDEMRLVVLEPPDIMPPFTSVPVAEQGPGATVWETQQGTVMVIPEEGPLPPGPSFLRSQGRKVACWLPLTTVHRRVGVLAFGSRSPVSYADDIAAFMAQIAAVVAIAVDNGINWEQAQRYQRDLLDERDRLQFLLDVNNLLVSHLDHRALLEAICEAVKRVIDADHIGVGLCDRESGQLRLDFVYSKTRGFSRPDITFPLDQSIAGLTIERGAAGVFLRPELEGRGWDGAAVDERVRDRVGVLRAARHSKRPARSTVCRQRPTGCILGERRHAARADVGADRHRSRKCPRLRGACRAQRALDRRKAVPRTRAQQRVRRDHRHERGPAKSAEVRQNRRACRQHRAAPWRDGHRQGADRARDPQPEPAARPDVRPDERGGDADWPARKRAVRPREGRVYRCDGEADRSSRARAPGHAVPRRGRRYPGGNSAQAAARPAGARVRTPRQHANPARWTCGSSRPRTAISSRWSKTARSDQISTIA